MADADDRAHLEPDPSPDRLRRMAEAVSRVTDLAAVSVGSAGLVGLVGPGPERDAACRRVGLRDART